MKQVRFTDEQIDRILRETDQDSVAEVAMRHVISQPTIYAWAVYFALVIDLTGNKQLLGLWIAQTEGAKFWLQVEPCVQDIFIACVDGLNGFVP